MSRLALLLLGFPEIQLDGQPVSTDRRKAVALLAYLAVNGQAQTRDALAALFWPDYEASSAYAYLRRTLYEIRQMVGGEWLQTEGSQVSLRAGPDLWLDVEAFRKGVAAGGDVEALTEAIALYRGDFMAGFSLQDAPEFDHWQRFQTEILRGDLGAAYEQQAMLYERQDQREQALAAAVHWLSLDNLHEPAHRLVMRLLAAQGNRVAALRQYEELERLLKQELGAEPEAATRELVASIRAGALVSQRKKAIAQSSPTRGSGYRSLASGRVWGIHPHQTGKATVFGHGLWDELIALAKVRYPEADFGFLEASLFSRPLTAQERQDYVRLIEIVRALQAENPVYEATYHHLLHLYVLNGSRLDLLKRVDRRLRGLAEGQGALLLIGGVSGIGKTSMVMAFQEHIRRLGARLIVARCSEQESTSYALWQRVARAAATTGMAIETLPAPIGDGKQAQSSPQLKQALAGWLKTQAASQPLVILLDDLHWADVDSLEMLNAVTQPTPARSCLWPPIAARNPIWNTPYTTICQAYSVTGLLI